jgi:hypothetical protein
VLNDDPNRLGDESHVRPRLTGNDALEFYYHGFRSALFRYRRLTIIGWLATAIGCTGLLASCREAFSGDVFALAIPLCAVVAGLALVHQSVAALDAYVAIPFPKPDPEQVPSYICEAVSECTRWMGEIERGGWQDAFHAIGAMATLAERYGLGEIQ